MYRAPSVVEMRARVTAMVAKAVSAVHGAARLLPVEWRRDVAQATGETALARIVADYVAGMTDRFAIQEHARLLGGDHAPPGG